MKPSKLWLLALASVFLLAIACNSNTAASPSPVPTSTATPSPVPMPTRTPLPSQDGTQNTMITLPNDPSLYDCGLALGGGAIDGFAGTTLGSETDEAGQTATVRYVYLSDPTNQDDLETTWCTWGRNGQTIKIIQSQYSFKELRGWYNQLGNRLWQVPGVVWTDLDETRRQLAVGFTPRRDTRAKIEAIADEIGIPQGAIRIESGCADPGHSGSGFIVIEPTPVPSTHPQARFLDATLEVPSEVEFGQTAPLTILVKNTGEEPITLGLGGGSNANFIVSDENGKEIWNWLCGKIFQMPLNLRTLEPGEEIEFSGEWEQVDYDSRPVTPGKYNVHAVFDTGLNLVEPDGDYRDKQVLISERVELTILHE